MMSDSLVLLITAYLYANIVLAPLIGVYLFLDVGRAPLASVLRFHKLLVTATVVLPLALAASSSLDTRSLTPVETVVSDISRDAQAVDSDQRPAIRATVNPEVTSAGEPAVIINDFVFALGDLFVWLSLAGLIAFVARYGLHALNVSRLIAAAEIREVRDDALVVRSRSIPSAFSAGCVLKRVFVPSWMSPASLEIVIRHELNHFACGHHIWSLFESALAHIFWFNPVSHLLVRRGRLFRELECDARTVRSVDKYQYANLLVESAERLGPRGAASACGHAWIDRNSLRVRIDCLLGVRGSMRRKAFHVSILAAIAFAVIAAMFLGSVNDRFLREQILASVASRYAEVLDSGPGVELERVPPVFIDALFVEYDRNFYRHDGVEPLCMARRAVALGLGLGPRGAPADDVSCRGATLTQQLARTLTFLSGRRSVERKLRELKVTRVLEDNFSKDELLEMYLNSAYFGNRAYGLAAASTTYFSKPYAELTRLESAMLVPFLAAPAAYNIRANPEVAAANQRRLLSMMTIPNSADRERVD